MSEPMESTAGECPYCGVRCVPGLSGHICEETDWMQHVENLDARIAQLELSLKWYGDRARDIQRYLKEKKLDAVEAVLTELSLDGGLRAQQQGGGDEDK